MGVPGLAWEPSGLFTKADSMIKMKMMKMMIIIAIIITKMLELLMMKHRGLSIGASSLFTTGAV